jgi:hypothetical protein
LRQLRRRLAEAPEPFGNAGELAPHTFAHGPTFCALAIERCRDRRNTLRQVGHLAFVMGERRVEFGAASGECLLESRGRRFERSNFLFSRTERLGMRLQTVDEGIDTRGKPAEFRGVMG